MLNTDANAFFWLLSDFCTNFRFLCSIPTSLTSRPSSLPTLSTHSVAENRFFVKCVTTSNAILFERNFVWTQFCSNAILFEQLLFGPQFCSNNYCPNAILFERSSNDFCSTEVGHFGASYVLMSKRYSVQLSKAKLQPKVEITDITWPTYVPLLTTYVTPTVGYQVGTR
jgi:hypothetical protein